MLDHEYGDIETTWDLFGLPWHIIVRINWKRKPLFNYCPIIFSWVCDPLAETHWTLTIPMNIFNEPSYLIKGFYLVDLLHSLAFWKSRIHSLLFSSRTYFLFNLKFHMMIRIVLISCLHTGCISFWATWNGCFQNCTRKHLQPVRLAVLSRLIGVPFQWCTSDRIFSQRALRL